MAEFIREIENYDWQVQTPDGWKDFSGIGKTVAYEEYRVRTDSRELICADDHILYCVCGENIIPTHVKNISKGDHIVTESGHERVFSVTKTGTFSQMYDLKDVAGGNKYFTNGILSHNSTTVVAYFLWYILFTLNSRAAILANKAATARELLGRLQLAYEYLPKFLQQGVVEWNKGNIELENGSKIEAHSTSSSSVRGKTFNCISGSETITIRDKETGKVQTLTLSKFEDLINKDKEITSKGGGNVNRKTRNTQKCINRKIET